MKKLLMGLALIAGASSHAQTTSAPLPAGTPATTPSAQTLTTSTQDAVPGIKQKFGASFSSENAVGMQKRKDQGEAAPVLSLWLAGLKYKVTPKSYVEVQQLMYTRSNLEGLEGAETVIFNEGKQQVMYDAVVKAGTSTDLRLLGSEPLAMSARYYLPTSQVSRDVQHRLGTLRGDVVPMWNLSTKTTLEMNISPRVTFVSADAPAGVSSDTIYRMVAGPVLTYNFNDNFNVYSAAIADVRSTNLARGKFEVNALNLITPEVGLNIMVGSLTINPAITSDLDIDLRPDFSTT